MKKSTTILFALVAVLSTTLASCSDNLHQTSGEYTFKTSGAVTLTGADTVKTVLLSDEVGTLTILDKNDNNDGVVLTINSSYGPVQTATARIAKNTLLVDDFSRTLEFSEFNPQLLQSDITKTTFDNVRVTGNGERYDDTIIFTWTYEGTSTDGKITLKGENIKTVATRK